MNAAYRWFLGYTLSTAAAALCNHQLTHSGIDSASEVIEGVFRWILEEVARAGYLSAEVVFVDGTHIKANANLKKQVKKADTALRRNAIRSSWMRKSKRSRAAHGKKPLKKDDDDDGPSAPGKQKTVAESTTDPESGVFHKGEHRKCFAYEAHTGMRQTGLYIWRRKLHPVTFTTSVAFDTVFERPEGALSGSTGHYRGRRATKRHGFASKSSTAEESHRSPTSGR